MTLVLRCWFGLLCAAAVAGVSADEATVRVWGSKDDSALLKAWAQGFEQASPGRHVVLDLRGGETPLMGVYTGVAEAALFTREVRVPAETMAFAWAWRYPMTTLSVANAAAETPRANGDLAVWVNARNPITHLTLAQLDGIFGAEAKRHAGVLRIWGQVIAAEGGARPPGALAPWTDRPIHVFGPPIDSVAGLYVRHAVLADSYKWNPDLHEIGSDAELLAAVAGDENAIAYAPRHGAPAGVKALALGAGPDGPFVELTNQTAGDRTYPLSRIVVMAINRTPGKPVAPATLAWLEYVLSPAGQAVVAADGTCLPLTPKQLKSQREKLQ
jgi:phosphate transport system substrate-binding protein